MELHAFYRKVAVTKPHDHGLTVLFATGRDLELSGQTLFFDDQRMITVCHHRGIDSAEDRAAVMLYHAGFAVHDAIGADYHSAERGTDRLVPEADPQDWNFSGKVADEVERDAGFVRRAWSGGQDDLTWNHVFDLIDRDLIVTTDTHFLSSLANVLDEVEGERVVVVENENHESASELHSV